MGFFDQLCNSMLNLCPHGEYKNCCSVCEHEFKVNDSIGYIEKESNKQVRHLKRQQYNDKIDALIKKQVEYKLKRK